MESAFPAGRGQGQAEIDWDEKRDGLPGGVRGKSEHGGLLRAGKGGKGRAREDGAG